MDEPSQPKSNGQEPDRVASNEPQPVGVAVVVHRSSDVGALSLDNVEGIEIRRSTFDINADVLSDRAVDVLLVDLTFPGERAIEFIRQSVDEHPQVGILALALTTWIRADGLVRQEVYGYLPKGLFGDGDFFEMESRVLAEWLRLAG